MMTNTIEITDIEADFILAYVEAINFTETGDVDQPKPGTLLDSTFYRECIIDCLSFYSRISCYLSSDQTLLAAHDFWFTRNGHGAGFWDGDWPVHGAMFDRIAQGFGEAYAIFEE